VADKLDLGLVSFAPHPISQIEGGPVAGLISINLSFTACR